jgi:putative copper resistance protein D
LDAVSLLQSGSAVLLNASFGWLLGSWCARRWLRASAVEDFEPALRTFDQVAAGLALLASVSALLAATAVMGGVGLRQAIPTFWTMISATDYGQAGAVTVLALLGVLLARGVGAHWRGADHAAALALATFAVTRASMGHAGENGFWTINVAAEAVHLFAIGAWTGIVMVSGWFVLNDARVAALTAHASASYLNLMSRAAMLAVAALVATGAYSGWQRVGTPDNLVNTAYGTTLLVKAGLVLAAIALGGYNKFVGLPAAARSMHRVRSVLRVETFLLLAALVAAAALTSQQPPAASTMEAPQKSPAMIAFAK